MKRITFKLHGMTYNNYKFISTIEDFAEYHEIDFGNKMALIRQHIQDRIIARGPNGDKYVGHATVPLVESFEFYASVKGIHPDKEVQHIHLAVIQNQLEDLTAGKMLAINDKGGYMSIKPDDDFEVIEFVEGFKYSKSDIKIKRFLRGNHYYAKIGDIDVIDEYGNGKWNTVERAEEVANKFLLKLNSDA